MQYPTRREAMRGPRRAACTSDVEGTQPWQRDALSGGLRSALQASLHESSIPYPSSAWGEYSHDYQVNGANLGLPKI